MPALTTITINDGESTPVAHSFEPMKIDDKDVAWFIETDGVAVRDNTLSVSLKKSSTVSRSKLALRLPTVVTETINGVDVDKVLRDGRVTVEFIFSSTSTPQERKNARTLLGNLLLNGFVEDVVDDGKHPYGG